MVPTSRFPAIVSEDVSLVAPYDGGGWGMIARADYVVQTVSAIGAALSTTLLVVGEGNVFRILAADCFHSAGTTASCRLFVQADGSAVACFITPDVASTSGGVNIPNIGTPIVPPGATLIGDHFGGGAATVITWRILGLEVPLGTGFQV